MNRRRFLALSSLGLLTAGSGCAALESDSGLPPGMTITTQHWRGWILKDVLTEDTKEPPTIAGTILTTKETALEQIHHDTPTKAFVEATDFTTSYLTAIEYFGSSSYTLEVHSINRQEANIHVQVTERSQSDYITADLAPQYLFIRITEETSKQPTNISTEIVS